MKLLVTGGAGFIGSATARRAIALGHEATVLDALTYAANLENLADIENAPNFRFIKADLRDAGATGAALAQARPDAIAHLAAESHVDRSIDGPGAFVETNVTGTFNLLQAALGYWRGLDAAAQRRFRYVQVSTDEVFGALGSAGRFSEDSRYAPNSPYAASKAGGDMLARAWRRTYGLPVIVTHGSNTYGPFQFPEKLIPVVVLSALEGRQIPVYGAGEQRRQWLFVEDHAAAILAALERGRPGESYAFGGAADRRNIDLVREICGILDALLPNSPHRPHAALIRFVEDRPGHDFRNAVDSAKASRELAWRPETPFNAGLRQTVAWYLENRGWWERVRDRAQRAGGPAIGARLGLAER